MNHTASTPGQQMASSTIRVPDGRCFTDVLTPEKQMRTHLGLIHSDTDGYVEIAAGRRPPGGKVRINTRSNPNQFLPGGHSGPTAWLDELEALATEHDHRDEEVFVGVAARSGRSGDKEAVSSSRFLWVDLDDPAGIPILDAFCNRPLATWAGDPQDPNAWLRTPHLVIETGGSGGRHAYWKLSEALPPTEINTETGEVIEPIERFNGRLVWALGVDPETGKPNVADVACRDRSRVLRLAGTRNFKTGAHARIVWADLWRPGYHLDELVGDLPDATHRAGVRKIREAPTGKRPDSDEHRHIPAVVFFERLAGIRVPERGLIQCPSPTHEDRSPSCSVSDFGFNCFGCGVGGTAVDLASLLEGGPTGSALRGDAFKRALQTVKDKCL